jgi:FkbM family methyltransferase
MTKKKRGIRWDFYRSTSFVRWLRTKPWTLQLRDFFRLMRFYNPVEAWSLSRTIWSKSDGLVELNHAVTQHPVYLRRCSSDSRVFYEIFGEKIYDFALPQQASCIIDIGANIGMASVFFAQHYPEARIIAVEPSGSNVSILRQNVASFPHISVQESGIWNRKEPLRFRNPEGDFWEFRVEPCREEEANFPTVTVPEIMELYGLPYIDILKIDIEGSERELFMNEDPAWLDHVGLMMIELHGDLLEERFDEVKSILARHGLHLLRGGINCFFARKNEQAVPASVGAAHNGPSDGLSA